MFVVTSCEIDGYEGVITVKEDAAEPGREFLVYFQSLRENVAPFQIGQPFHGTFRLDNVFRSTKTQKNALTFLDQSSGAKKTPASRFVARITKNLGRSLYEAEIDGCFRVTISVFHDADYQPGDLVGGTGYLTAENIYDDPSAK